MAPQRAASIAVGDEQTGTLSHQTYSLLQRRPKAQINCQYKTAACHAFSRNRAPLGAVKPRARRVHPLAFGLQSVHRHDYAANTKTAG